MEISDLDTAAPVHIVSCSSRTLAVKHLYKYVGGIARSQPSEKYQAIPERMRLAGGAYKRSADVRLAAAGLEDLPTTGGYLLAYLATGEESIADMILGLGFTKQAFSQLVDTMVLRGFIIRNIDPDDRRRMTLRMTEREGRPRTKPVTRGASRWTRSWSGDLRQRKMAGLRKGLSVLAEIKASLKDQAIRRGLAKV